MSLPPAAELSRWTVREVTVWLTESSLTVFRDYFLQESIDGTKLMRITEQDVDRKYHVVPQRKRNILKEHLKRIEASRSTLSWNVKSPDLPPRPGGTNKPPARLPSQDDFMSSDEDDWDDEFEEDDIDAEYLEPTEHLHPSNGQGHKVNGLHFEPDEPQSEYAIPLEDCGSHVQLSSDIKRAPSLVDKLRQELTIRRQSKEIAVDTPPARPPRPDKPTNTNYINTLSESAAPSPRSTVLLPAEIPEQTYEIMDQPTEIKTTHVVKDAEPAAAARKDPPLPPRRANQSQAGGWLHNNHRAAASPTSQDDLSIYEWYHGKIGRDIAQNIFQRERQDGMFLIRKSERNPEQPYTLVIWHINRIWNIPIRQMSDGLFAAGKFKPGETKFKTIVELVEHFKVKPLNLLSGDKAAGGVYNLTTPAPKS